MEWILLNWVWILIFIVFIAMHLFGHGCMGGHGRHGEEEGEEHKGHQEKKGGHGCC